MRTDDCVIRAVSKVLNIPWEEAYLQLSMKGLELYDWGNSNAVWGALLRDKGFERELIPNTCPDCFTINDFCRENPKGTFVLGTGTHAVAVVDGDYYDTWASGDQVPIYAYRKE
jgi:hypothetical protein